VQKAPKYTCRPLKH